MKSVKYEIKEESFSSEELFKSELNEMMALIDYKQFAPKLESVKIEQTDVELNHQKYKAENLAEIPDFIEEKCDEFDDDEYILQPTGEDSKFTHNDMNRVLRETGLPTEVAFGICSFNDYNVAETIEMSKDFVVPDMIPQFVQDIFVAKIAETRDAFKQKKTHSAEFKEFYLAELFHNIVEPKLLVENYYNQKNKIGNNWRMDRVEEQMTDEERQILEEKMKACNISIIESHHVKKSHKRKRNKEIDACKQPRNYKEIDLATHLSDLQN
ncbi:Coiled-coil domain-containing protein [Caenorhabditis elegans]|uniref:Coiled-coil domain-containing protein n=1 Tax=Caenorhabditis elegans TaxID=6239 RepID=Q93517_CAEEL|nr:Coiled-coil domain-containing protein [Caenorhabditis elegans]CAB02961.2 Coiled-coil domain-containing protein [Caenorhabditis elegans]|eukprot:NP_510347.2 Uncharacterized protein CELE_F16B12.4 [Caenorhabditis elegans]